MSDFICPECGTDVLDSKSGDFVGCVHYPEEDLTTMSGKLMSDGKHPIPQADADVLAFQILTEAKKRHGRQHD